MRIEDYFESVEYSLRNHIAIHYIEEPTILSISDGFNGLIKIRAFFWNGSFLDIHETASTSLGFPIRIHYAYTFISDDVQVFRYDNAPHHREMITFPHHKHLGREEKPVPSDQPSLNQILMEIETFLKR